MDSQLISWKHSFTFLYKRTHESFQQKSKIRKLFWNVCGRKSYIICNNSAFDIKLGAVSQITLLKQLHGVVRQAILLLCLDERNRNSDSTFYVGKLITNRAHFDRISCLFSFQQYLRLLQGK